MRNIINLTQHKPTEDQRNAGVFSVPFRNINLYDLLTFDEIPNTEEMERRANKISNAAYEIDGFKQALIGGAPFFMPSLKEYARK